SFCLLLAACVFTFLLGEIGLRIFGIAYPYFYLPDPITGYFHKPGAEGLWQKEGETYITINRAGLRNREISVEKPPHTFRVALLGDSYTEALQLPLDLTYGSRLEHALTGCPALVGQNVEVV